MKSAVAAVSVVIPCFRSKNTIGRAVQSVVAQRVLPKEIIIVDDCSGDGTLDELRRLQAALPGLVRIVPLAANSGAATARNAGWSMATQPYVAFLDSDDSWHPDKITIQYEWMRRNPGVDMTCHDLPRFANKPPAVSDANISSQRIGKNKILSSNVVYTPTVMMKRDVAFRFPEGRRYSEDYLLWLSLCLSGAVCVKLNAPLAFRYKEVYGAGGLSSHLWAMEREELLNYYILYKRRQLSPMAAVFFGLISIAKFCRRLSITFARRCFR